MTTRTRKLGEVWSADEGQSVALQQGNVQLAPTSGLYVTGEQFLVVCCGEVAHCDLKADAERQAARLAHKYQTDAFVLAPILLVAPKREVVTTPISLEK